MLALVVILNALWGFSFTLGKMLLSYASPFFIVAARMMVGGLALLAYMFFRHRIHCKPRPSDLWLYFQQMVFGILIFYCVRQWGLQYVEANKAALLCNLLPFFTATFAYFHFRERLNWMQVSGLIIGFIGTIPLLLTSSAYEQSVGGIGFISWPELAIIISVASLGYSIIVMQMLVKHRSCPAPLVNGCCMLVGGSLAFCWSSLAEPVWIRGDITTLLLLMGGQVIISSLICSNLQATLLRHYSATFLSFASFLSPLFTIIYGYFLLGEQVTWNFFVSFIIVVSGLSLYHYKEFKQWLHTRHSHS